jgi:DNA-directed RNA polymerase subunit RPC12/RpoP
MKVKEIKIKLRENLNVEIKPWIGKTKKDFMGLFRKNGVNVNQEQVFDVLLKPYIIPDKNFFLFEEEKQYLLIKLKEISFKDNFEFEIVCSECGNNFIVESNLDQITNYSIGKDLEKIESELVKFRYFTEEQLKIMKSKLDENEKLLQLYLSISRIKDKEISSIEDIVEGLEELTLKEYNEIEKIFLESQSKLKLGLEISCPHCEDTKEYNFDIIPKFFDELLPIS